MWSTVIKDLLLDNCPQLSRIARKPMFVTSAAIAPVFGSQFADAKSDHEANNPGESVSYKFLVVGRGQWKKVIKVKRQ